VLDPDFPYSRDNNRLLFTEPVDADTVEAAAAEVAGNAGWPHQAAALLWPDAAGTAAELGRRGWELEENLLMAWTGGPVQGGERAEIVAQAEVHDLWERSWRRNLAGTRDLERVVEQLVGREHLNDRVVAVHDIVVREQGRVVAAGQLRVDGATAAVDSVLTDPEAQGRGYADAFLARALDLATDAGCDLVVLEAAADDWPRHWYARRGFETLASAWGANREP
jgi:GNAT superfamily N-acetyltransferase